MTSFFLAPAVTTQVIKHAPHLDIVESPSKAMALLFWLFAAMTIGGALFVVTRRNLIAAVMGMVGSFLGIAAVYMMLYASFLAIVQLLVYAGAIMVLFVFVVMMLNLGPAIAEQERKWLKPGVWIGPGVLSAVLLVELLLVLSRNPSGAGIGPGRVGSASTSAPWTLIGTSSHAGPGRPVVAATHAASTNAGTSSAVSACSAHLAIGRTTSTVRPPGTTSA